MKSMLAMVSLGIGEIVGAIFIGQVIDKIGNRFTSISILTLLVI
jgi:predicted MFS family arabinose efflux permease